MANSVDSDQMAHNKPSHLDLHYLQQTLSRSTGLKELKMMEKKKTVNKSGS